MAKTKRKQLAALAAQAELRELAALKERIAACKKANVPGVYRLNNPQVEIRTQRVIFKIPALPSKSVASIPDKQQQATTEAAGRRRGVEAVGGKQTRTKMVAVRRRRKQQPKEKLVGSDEIVGAKRGQKRRQKKEPAVDVDVPADETKLSKGIVQFGRWKRRKRIADLLPASRPVDTILPSQILPNPESAEAIQQHENGEKITESHRPEETAQILPFPSGRRSVIKTYKRKVKFTLGSPRKRKKQLQDVTFRSQGLSATPLQKGQPLQEVAARQTPEKTAQAASAYDTNGLAGADRMAWTSDLGTARNSEAVSERASSQDGGAALEPKEISLGAIAGKGANNLSALSPQTSIKGKVRRGRKGRKVALRRRKGLLSQVREGAQEPNNFSVGAEVGEKPSNPSVYSLQNSKNGGFAFGKEGPPRRRIRVKYSALLSQPRPRTRAQVSKLQALTAVARVADALEGALDQQHMEGTGNTIAVEDLRHLENGSGRIAMDTETRVGEKSAQIAVQVAEETEHANILKNIKNRSNNVSEADGNPTRTKFEEHRMVKLQNGGATVPAVDFGEELGQAAAHVSSGTEVSVLRVADRIKEEMQAAIVKRRLEAAGGLTKWLLDKGLAQFLPLFEGRINVYVFLSQLTMEGLKSMGFIPVGPRRKLVHAASTLILPSIPRPIRSNF